MIYSVIGKQEVAESFLFFFFFLILITIVNWLWRGTSLQTKLSLLIKRDVV